MVHCRIGIMVIRDDKRNHEELDKGREPKPTIDHARERDIIFVASFVSGNAKPTTRHGFVWTEWVDETRHVLDVNIVR